VLCELLTGRAVFPGETISDTIAAILERDPQWGALPAHTPAGIGQLLRRCLDKDPKRQLRDIGDVRIEIDEIGEALRLSLRRRPALRRQPVAAPAVVIELDRSRVAVGLSVGLSAGQREQDVKDGKRDGDGAPAIVVRVDAFHHCGCI
jgi:hypothetical protein